MGDSALDLASLSCPINGTGETAGAGIPQESGLSKNEDSAMLHFEWDNGPRVYEQPETTLGIGHFDDDAAAQPPLPILLNEWGLNLDFDSSGAEPAGFVDIFGLSLHNHTWGCGGSERPPHESDCSTSQYGLAWPVPAAEPVCPSSPSSISSMPPVERHRHNSSSPWSRRHTLGQPRSTVCEHFRLPINSVRHTKCTSKDAGDLFYCESCDRGFRYKKDLRRHRLSVHIRKPSWFCPVQECKFFEFGFIRKDKAFQHIRVHQRTSDATSIPISYTERKQTERLGLPLNTLDLPRPSSASTNPSTISKPTSSHNIDGGKSIKHNHLQHQNDVAYGTANTHTNFGYEATFVNQRNPEVHSESLDISAEATDEYRCASIKCRLADKIWPRLDSFKHHVLRRHAEEDVQNLIQRSIRSRSEATDGFPIMIVTPEMFSKAPQPDSTCATSTEALQHI